MNKLLICPFMALFLTAGAVYYMMGSDITAVRAQGLPTATEDEDARLQVMPHDFVAYSSHYRVFIKLDRITGETWRFHAGNIQWTPIAEAKGQVLGTSDYNRYELVAHEFNKTPDSWDEVILRVDKATGDTWMYQATYRQWKRIDTTVNTPR